MVIGEIIEHFDMFNDKVGLQILPNTRAKYMEGDRMYFASAKYRDCVIEYLSAKNDCVVFVVSHAEAVKHGLVKEN